MWHAVPYLLAGLQDADVRTRRTNALSSSDKTWSLSSWSRREARYCRLLERIDRSLAFERVGVHDGKGRGAE